ncbi:hypothetical protein REPUB_Repub02eG0209700 [Reevesia pubescens]
MCLQMTTFSFGDLNFMQAWYVKCGMLSKMTELLSRVLNGANLGGQLGDNLEMFASIKAIQDVQDLGVRLGEELGYPILFEDRSSETNTK